MQVYMDNAASSRIDEEVLQEMMPYFRDIYANPAGACSFSARARKAVGKAREQVAGLIGAEADEIIFTSGGTESDNMAVFGVLKGQEDHKVPGKGTSERMAGNRIITSTIEHPAVLNACREAGKRGCDVIYAPCNESGLVDLNFIEKHLNDRTVLVSVMAVNNELGTAQDIYSIAGAAHKYGAVFHTDAVQAAGQLPITVRRSSEGKERPIFYSDPFESLMISTGNTAQTQGREFTGSGCDIDLMSISSHKLHGPKGVGALFVKRGLRLGITSFGGGQENGLRSGTLNVPGIVGFGKACEIARTGMNDIVRELSGKREYLTGRILENIDNVSVNSPAVSSPSIVSLSFAGVEGSSLLIELDMRGVCCSTGSACSASSSKPSYVLTACGMPEERIRGSLRLSFSRLTTTEEIDHTVKALKESVDKLRKVTLYND